MSWKTHFIFKVLLLRWKQKKSLKLSLYAQRNVFFHRDCINRQLDEKWDLPRKHCTKFTFMSNFIMQLFWFNYAIISYRNKSFLFSLPLNFYKTRIVFFTFFSFFFLSKFTFEIKIHAIVEKKKRPTRSTVCY